MNNCPFCGSGDIIACFTEGKKDGKIVYQSGCCNCGASGPESKSVDGAVRLWNAWCGFPEKNERFPCFDGSDEKIRPLEWVFELVTIGGKKTNAVEIYFPANKGDYEVPGYHGEILSRVSLTRAEIKEMLNVLEDDISKMRQYCPDTEFV